MEALASPKPRVLVVHNAYQQRGGEDSVVDAELNLLRNNGHDVEIYCRHNNELRSTSPASAAVNSIWSIQSGNDFEIAVRQFRPAIVHVHNVFPLISPSIFWRAGSLGIPIVQTLHNFRLLCPQAQFLREGKVCEDCLGHLPWRAVKHACYRNSRLQSAASAASISLHRLLGTYERKVSAYIALNEFCREKFIEGGLPRQRVHIKPNFVDLPLPDAKTPAKRKGALYVGRLSADKGVATLLEASRIYPFLANIVGAGEYEATLSHRFGTGFLGFRSLVEIFRLMEESSYLVVPSIWYENFPRTIVEAYACGLPVIASRLGALAEVVVEGETGLLFEPGNAEDLSSKLRWAEEHPLDMERMGRNARARYEMLYSPDRNYEILRSIYQMALEKLH